MEINTFKKLLKQGKKILFTIPFLPNIALAACTRVGGLTNLYCNIDRNNIKFSDVPMLLANIGSMLLEIGGVVAIGVFIYGGILYITSAGNEKQVEKAQNILTFGIVGLILIIASYTIVIWVKNRLL